MTLVKSKQRVADHGEVFTPPWMVEAMLDLVKAESERIGAAYADKVINQAREQAQTQVQISQAQLNELQNQHLEKIRTSEAAFRQLEAQQDPYRYASRSITVTTAITLKDALEQHYGEEERRGHVAKTMLEKKPSLPTFWASLATFH